MEEILTQHLMRPKVLFLTQWFDPEPGCKGLVFTRELIRQGFAVEVVTGFPNYPGGKVYPGYKIRWLQREMIDGVHITRLPLYPSHDQSVIKRILNYVSFAASSLIYGLFVAKRADVIYAYHPPLTVGITASLLRLFRRIPVVYDIQDMWPDTLRATGMVNSARALAVVGWVCQFVYRQVDRIVVLSPGFKGLLLTRGVSAEKMEVIYNWADEASLVAPVEPEFVRLPEDGRFKVLFAGNMGKAQALDAVIDAAALLQGCGAKACFVMLGGGIEVARLQQRVEDMHLTNVVFLPAVPMSQVGALLQKADALLVHLRKDPLFQITIPSKTQAYMAVGKPLLMAVNGDAADLVLESGGGVVAASENPKALAEAVEKLSALPPAALSEMGMKAKVYYQKHLSLSVGASRFGEIFNELANRTPC